MFLKWFKLLNISAGMAYISVPVVEITWIFFSFRVVINVKFLVIQHSKAPTILSFWLREKKNTRFKSLLFVVCAWVAIHSIHWQAAPQFTWHKYKLNSSPTGNLLFDLFNERSGQKKLSRERKKCGRKQSPVWHLWFTSFETKANIITKASSLNSTGGPKNHFNRIAYSVCMCIYLHWTHTGNDTKDCCKCDIYPKKREYQHQHHTKNEWVCT